MLNIRTVDGTQNSHKKPRDSASDYINLKGYYPLNSQTVADPKYCFIDVVIKWPRIVNDTRSSSNSSISHQFWDNTISSCERVIVEGKPEVPVCILGDPTYPLLPY